MLEHIVKDKESAEYNENRGGKIYRNFDNTYSLSSTDSSISFINLTVSMLFSAPTSYSIMEPTILSRDLS